VPFELKHHKEKIIAKLTKFLSELYHDYHTAACMAKINLKLKQNTNKINEHTTH